MIHFKYVIGTCSGETGNISEQPGLSQDFKTARPTQQRFQKDPSNLLGIDIHVAIRQQWLLWIRKWYFVIQFSLTKRNLIKWKRPWLPLAIAQSFIKLQNTHFLETIIIKIFIKLYSTNFFKIKYVWIYLQYLEYVNAEDAGKNACLQRLLQNFPPVQFRNCPTKRQGDGSLARTLCHSDKRLI